MAERREDETDPLIAPRSMAAWQRYTERLKLWEAASRMRGRASTSGGKKRKRSELDEAEANGEGEVVQQLDSVGSEDERDSSDQSDVLYDTVGAICIDESGHAVAGVSRYDRLRAP